MPEPVIVTEGLTKRFGDFTAVDAVTFAVEAREVVGYLGPNGSGKTTTIRMLLGLLRSSAGRAEVLGYDIDRETEAIRQRVGYMSQKFALYDDLTVWENLTFYAGVYGVMETGHLTDTLARVGMGDLHRERVADLPVGWRQRLALATAIVHNPRLLFLDEPTSGVDPLARRAFWDLIYELVESGITAFVTTHFMDEAEYCQRVGIMRAGRLLAMDAPSALKREALPGRAWDVRPADLLAALAALEAAPGVQRVGLAGDHLRVIAAADVEGAALAKAAGDGRAGVEVTPAEPSLEDVFLALAG
ncbi:MAG: ABC transporter ATP-binding protein [Chloroflexi bacterium]|nr:ABC transporter ATP-binding protein [Chloroflexota bacterium]